MSFPRDCNQSPRIQSVRMPLQVPLQVDVVKSGLVQDVAQLAARVNIE